MHSWMRSATPPKADADVRGDQDSDSGSSGSGPLYDHGEAGKKAAEQPVVIPGSDHASPVDAPPSARQQVAANIEDDPPA